MQHNLPSPHWWEESSGWVVFDCVALTPQPSTPSLHPTLTQATPDSRPTHTHKNTHKQTHNTQTRTFEFERKALQRAALVRQATAQSAGAPAGMIPPHPTSPHPSPSQPSVAACRGRGQRHRPRDYDTHTNSRKRGGGARTTITSLQSGAALRDWLPTSLPSRSAQIPTLTPCSSGQIPNLTACRSGRIPTLTPCRSGQILTLATALRSPPIPPRSDPHPYRLAEAFPCRSATHPSRPAQIQAESQASVVRMARTIASAKQARTALEPGTTSRAFSVVMLPVFLFGGRAARRPSFASVSSSKFYQM